MLPCRFYPFNVAAETFHALRVLETQPVNGGDKMCEMAD
jgi:hypothetical protein